MRPLLSTLALVLLLADVARAQIILERQLSNGTWEEVLTEQDIGERQLNTFPTPRTTFRLVKPAGTFINPTSTITPLIGVASDFQVSGLNPSSQNPDSFTVGLQPTTLGLKKASIKIEYPNGQSITFIVFGDGTGINRLDVDISSNPNITGSPIQNGSTTNFGSANLSTASFPSRWIRFQAYAAPITVTNISLGSSFEFVGTAPTSLSIPQFGHSQIFEIRFKPTTAGTFTNTFSVTHSSPDGFTSANFSGTATGTARPAISLESSSSSAGPFSVVTGQDNFGPFTEPSGGTVTATRYYRIQNTGIAPLVLSGASPISNGFVFLGTPSGTIQPGAYGSNFQIRFTGSTAGLSTSTLSISSNATGFARTLRAVITPDISSLTASGFFPNGTQMSLPSGGQPVDDLTRIIADLNDPAENRVIRFTNGGSSTLTDVSLTGSTGVFEFDAIAPFSLAPGATRDIDVTFNPILPGTQFGALFLRVGPPSAQASYVISLRAEIEDLPPDGPGDPNLAVIEVRLVNSPSAAALLNRTPSITASSADGRLFDDSWAGLHYADTPFKITNTGAQPLLVQHPSVTGPAAAAFSFPEFTRFGGALVVNPGETYNATVRYDPFELGTTDAEITFTSNASNSPNFAIGIRSAPMAQQNLPALRISATQLLSLPEPYERIPIDGLTTSTDAGTFMGPVATDERARVFFRVVKTAFSPGADLRLDAEPSVDSPYFLVKPVSSRPSYSGPFPEFIDDDDDEFYFEVEFNGVGHRAPDGFHQTTLTIVTNGWPNTVNVLLQGLVENGETVVNLTRVEGSEVTIDGVPRRKITFFGHGDPREVYQFERDPSLSGLWDLIGIDTVGDALLGNIAIRGTVEESPFLEITLPDDAPRDFVRFAQPAQN